MEYKHIDGMVYSRYASSPPVINSNLAGEYGIQVPCPLEPGQYTQFKVGSNVKLRMVIDAGKTKMTCHAMIDWVDKDEQTGQCIVGFGHLSLTDDEFVVLERNFTVRSEKHLEFGDRVRDKAPEAAPLTGTKKAREIMRLKAVNFPVSVIEAIDENRRDVPFSEFVTTAVRSYIKGLSTEGTGS